MYHAVIGYRPVERAHLTHDYVDNDHKVGQMLKKLMKKELEWDQVYKVKHRQESSLQRKAFSVMIVGLRIKYI